MATQIYITDAVKGMLDRLTELDCRSQVDEVLFLCEQRLAAIEAENKIAQLKSE